MLEDDQGEQAISLMHRIKTDPEFFVREILGENLWSKQREIMLSVRDNKRTGVRSCHGAGKSFIAARVALQFLYGNPYAIVATTAPTFRQVEKVLWQELRRAYGKARVHLGGSLLQTELKIADGWYAFGFSADDPNAFQGLHSSSGHVLVIGDEAAGLSPAIMEGIEAILTGDGSRLLLIGNPTDPSSEFAKVFTEPGTKKIAISAYDTPNLRAGKILVPGLVDPDWVQDKIKRWGKRSPLFQSRVLGQFPVIGNDMIYPLHWVERAFVDQLPPDPIEVTCTRVLGVDVARMGDDSTVYVLRTSASGYKDKYRVLLKTHKERTTATTGRAIKLATEYGCDKIVVDDSGVGGGVTDSLLEQGYPVIGVNVGEGAIEDNKYLNLRAELHWLFREDLENRRVIIEEDEDFLSQATNIKYKFSSRGLIQVERKEDIKKRKLPSPDVLDAMLLASCKSYNVPLIGADGSSAASTFAAVM